jgi:UDP-glucuronate decarboxylase
VEGGRDVLCVGNFATGANKNIVHLLGRPNFELLRHDITFPLSLPAAFICNLGCPASPTHYQKDPVQAITTNVYGSLNMLELCVRTGAQILQASTSEVYGDPEVHPQVETYWGHVNPVGPRACYDEGKRCAETLFFECRRKHGVRIKVARLFNTYGPRMQANDGHVVSDFIVQALTDGPITIFGDDSQTRLFCYVDDMIEGLVRLMSAPEEFTWPVNLGSSVEFTIAELAEHTVELCNSRSPVVRMSLPSDDPRLRRPVVTLARDRLAWSATTPPRAGLIKTIEYFDRELTRNSFGAMKVPAVAYR